MKLSTKGRYAVRALVDLTRYCESGPVNLKSISEREGISVSYLEQLFNRLRRKGIVKSVRGPGGGYLLGREKVDITIADVIDAVEEQLSIVDCATEGDDGFGCERIEDCITRLVWQDLGQEVRRFLTSITMDDLYTKSQEMLAKKTDRPASC